VHFKVEPASARSKGIPAVAEQTQIANTVDEMKKPKSAVKHDRKHNFWCHCSQVLKTIHTQDHHHILHVINLLELCQHPKHLSIVNGRFKYLVFSSVANVFQFFLVFLLTVGRAFSS